MDDLTCNYPMKYLFLLATVTVITVKLYFTHFHSSSCQENILENGIKQIKITEENSSQSFILSQLLTTKTLASGSKCIKHFF